MTWFKHMTDMADDPRLKRVIRKHGGMAYAIYNYVLERIGKRLDADSPAPDLEETAEDIADFFRYDTVKVEEIMWSCISEGLFEQDEVTGRVLCHKMYKFLQKSQTRNEAMRRMIDAYAGLSQTVSDNCGASQTIMIDESRLDENRIEEREESGKADATHPKTNQPMNQATYNSLITDYGKPTVDDYFERVQDYCSAKGKRYKDHAATVRNWMKRDNVPKLRKETGPPIDVTQFGGGAA